MQAKFPLSGWLAFLALLLITTSCDRDEIDVTANTNFPPSILSATPSADGRVVAGDFDVTIVFADGTVSPLQSATVTLMDSNMTEIVSVTEDLSGIQDSLVIDGDSFGATDLGVGFYNMRVSVTDTDGQTTEQEYSFEISNLPFAANNDQIFIAGELNGWSADAAELEDFEFTLVDDNIWEIREIELTGAWKLKNTVDWTDLDWGDGDCDGFMTNNNDGNADTNCGNSGLVNIRFNDETLSYTVAQAVTLASNTMSLYLLGSFNDFNGGEYQFELTDDNTWFLDEARLEPGDQYKFAEMPDFIGINYGDDNNDGVAQQGGGNFVVPDSVEAGFYSITFNDQTLTYETELVRALLPENIGIIGNATPNGWDSDTDMEVVEPGVYRVTIDLVASTADADSTFAKFRANDEWVDDWGGDEFPSGTAVYKGNNIYIPESGTYTVTLNLNDLTYNFELETGPGSIGIIGSATPTGWDSDTDLEETEPGVYTITIDLTAGTADEPTFVKFRADDEWVDDWGGSEFPSGTAVYKGGDIMVPESGTYRVTFNLNELTYNFELQ